MKPMFPKHPRLLPENDRFVCNAEGCDIYQVWAKSLPTYLYGWLLVFGAAEGCFITTTPQGSNDQPIPAEAEKAFEVLRALIQLHQ